MGEDTMTHAAITRAWTILTPAGRPHAGSDSVARIETISAPSQVNQVCRCDAVWPMSQGESPSLLREEKARRSGANFECSANHDND
jgi:hypothetical protein